jgi:signal transduction histidine kinase
MKADIGFQTTDDDICLKAVLDTSSEIRYIEIAYPHFSEVQFHTIDDSGELHSVHTGTNYAFDTRSIRSNLFVFRVQPTARVVYFQVRSRHSIALPLRVYTYSELLEKQNLTHLWQGIYFGFVLLVILYSLLLFWAIRDAVYGYYSLATLGIGVVTAIYNNYTFQFLWADYPQLNQYINAFTALAAIPLIWFAQRFFDVSKPFSGVSIVFRAFILIYLLSSILCFAGFFRLSSLIARLNSLGYTLFILYWSVQIYRRKYRPARFFILAHTIHFLGVSILIFTLWHLLEVNAFTLNVAQIGSAIEILIFSIAIADRMREYRKQKQKTEQDLVVELNKNIDLKASQQAILEKRIKEGITALEEKHQEILMQNEELLSTQDTLIQKQQELEKINRKYKNGEEVLKKAVVKLKETQSEIELKNEAIRQQNEELKAQTAQMEEAYEEISTLNQRLEEKVKSRTAELEKTNQELDSFLYNASHALRRPLTTFMGLSELAKIILQDKAGLDLFAKVQNNAVSMDKMLRKLQMLSEVYQSELLYRPIHLGSILEEIQEDLKDLIAEFDVAFYFESEQEPMIRTDAFLLKIVLYNLLENALFFRSEAHPWVKVTLHSTTITHAITIRDNGIGIEPIYLDKIFEMFYRASNVSHGNGLGLFVAKKAIDKLKAHIECVPTDKYSSEFLITLPRK